MGCYDTIYFEKPFKCKNCGREIIECQTKDLGEGLANYVITEDDRFREGWLRYVDSKKRAKKYRFINDIGFGCYDYCSLKTDDKCKISHYFYIIVMDGKIAKIKYTFHKDT